MKLLSPITRPVEDRPLQTNVTLTPGINSPVDHGKVQSDKLDPEAFIIEHAVVDPETGFSVVDDFDKTLNDFDLDKTRSMLQAQKDRLLELQERCKQVEKDIDNKVSKSGNSSVVVSKDDINTLSAVRRVFGRKTQTITYEMYKQALALTERFNKEELDSVTKDSPVKLGQGPCQ